MTGVTMRRAETFLAESCLDEVLDMQGLDIPRLNWLSKATLESRPLFGGRIQEARPLDEHEYRLQRWAGRALSLRMA